MHYPVQYLWSKTMLPFANIEGRGLKTKPRRKMLSSMSKIRPVKEINLLIALLYTTAYKSHCVSPTLRRSATNATALLGPFCVITFLQC